MKKIRAISPAKLTLFTLLFAIISGFVLRIFCPTLLSAWIDGYLLTPVKTMYLNALKLVVTPVVFFMISSSIAGVGDYKTYGRIGGRVIFGYILTSIAAIGIGMTSVLLLNPAGSMSLSAPAAGYEASTTDISLLYTVVNLVPSSFISPFLESNMLQIIFLSALVGGAAGILAQQQNLPQIRNGLEIMNKLLLTISSFILRLIPVATFCAVTQLILQIDTETMVGLLNLILTVFFADLAMVGLYGLLFFCFTRNSPLLLLKKCLPNIASFAMFCSTSAVMPQTLDTCTNKLGIHPKISSFSMPLGSTINMDGACIYLSVASIFLCAIYNITLTPSILIQMGFTILLLSVGAPPVPGAGFICLSVLVLQLGIPMESIGYLLGIDQLMSILRTVVNGSGDIVVTSIVADKEGLMDKEIFRS